VDRKTVSRYVRLAEQDSKSAQAPLGSDGLAPVGALSPPPDSKGTNAPLGSVANSLPSAVAQFLARPGGRGRRSDCEPYRDLILAKLDQGLSAQRIYQEWKPTLEYALANVPQARQARAHTLPVM